MTFPTPSPAAAASTAPNVNATISIVDMVRSHMGRDLTPTEQRLLLLLAPAGVAKVNHDISQGNNLEDCLKELEIILENVRLRNVGAKEKLAESELANKFAKGMRVKPTADEMVFLATAPYALMRAMLSDRLRGGETLEDAIEDSALEYQLDRLASESEMLAAFYRLDVTTDHLPTTEPTYVESSLGPSASYPYKMCRLEDKIMVGPSPLSLWFNERALNLTLEQLQQSDQIPVARVLSPRNSTSSSQQQKASCHPLHNTNVDGVATASDSSATSLPAPSVPAAGGSLEKVHNQCASAEFPVLTIDTTQAGASASSTTTTGAATAKQVRFAALQGDPNEDPLHNPPITPPPRKSLLRLRNSTTRLMVSCVPPPLPRAFGNLKAKTMGLWMRITHPHHHRPQTPAASKGRRSGAHPTTTTNTKGSESAGAGAALNYASPSSLSDHTHGSPVPVH